MFSRIITLALGACVLGLANARDMVLFGDISDAQMQAVMDTWYDPVRFGHLDLENGPHIAAMGVSNETSMNIADPFGFMGTAMEGLVTRDDLTCENNGSPSPTQQFLVDNNYRLSAAAGSLAGSAAGGIFIIVQNVACLERRVCSVILQIAAIGAGAFAYAEVSNDVMMAINTIHNQCPAQKGLDLPTNQLLSTRISTSTSAYTSCSSVGGTSSNCKTVTARK